MAGRIQGITVEIGGDTTKLQTALKGVNTEIRNTQSQLRDVDKLLKLDPGNTELLTQKHRLLGDAVKETKEKLETLKTAAEAMNYMAMAGWKTEDMLSGIEGVMNLAAASGEDLATTSDIVTDALTAFGLTAKDSGHFADILAAASSNANTNVSMMGETFKYCAPIAGALGFSAEDTAEAIGLMANAGIKGSQAGTSLRTIMNNLSGEVKICGSSIGEVTVATTNADGSMRDLSDILADCRTAFSGLSESEKAAAAESLVGKNAMSGFLALMNAGEADIEKLSSAIDNCDGSAASMAETMNDNLAGQLQILKSQLEELAISFGELLMPAIRTIVGWIQKTDYQSWIPDFIGGLAKGIEKSRGMIENAMNGVTSDLTITPRVMAAQGGYSGSAATSGDLISGINTALNTALAGGGAAGDIVIPVYIGGDMIDEIVVTAQQRMNLRSGGR